MNCPFCRKTIVENSEFCPYCGNKTRKDITTTQNYVDNYSSSYNQPKKSSNVKYIIIIALIVIAIIVGICYMNHKKDTNKTEENTTNQENKKPNNSENLDQNIDTIYDENGAFLMAIEDVFVIEGRGTCVTGRIERGTIRLGDKVDIVGLGKETKTVKVVSIEQYRDWLDSAKIGDNVGITLSDVKKEDVERGQVLSAPNSIIAATKFEANIDVLSKEEGGRRTPIDNHYSSQFYFRTTDTRGVITLPESIEIVNPGESVNNVTVKLERSVALEVGTKFSIREGGRTVGKGTITKIIE